jgi:PEGA domain
MAIPRPNNGTNQRSSLYGPWGWWYPWYTPGLGLGYVTYDPWLYGSTSWIYGRYGLWYDPFGYYYPGYGYPYSYAPYAPYEPYGTEEASGQVGQPTGSLRLKVKPETAKVYVDGALMGTADEFGGLFHHLELEAGAHELELRADGYQTYTVDVTVVAGKTMTERISLTKK